MSETLSQTTARISEFILNVAPNVDLSPGSVFNELILSLETQIQNNVYNDLQNLSAGKAVTQALAIAGDTYNPVIDQVASNYNVERGMGSKATGTIQVTVAKAGSSITIPANTVFVQPSLLFSYVTTVQTVVQTGNNTLTPLTENPNSPLVFNLPVQATAIGVDQTVSDGTAFQLEAPSSIPYFVSARAFGSFQTGQSMETDKQLIARFKSGLSVANLTSADSIATVLRDSYPDFQSVYLADQTNPVNLRAGANPLGLKLPGAVDVYLKNSATLTSVEITSDTAGVTQSYSNQIWTINIPAAAAPGFYRVLNVVNANDRNTPLDFGVIYGVSAEGANTNVVETAAQARYSVYQTAALSVTYNNGGVPTGFIITVLCARDLAEVQNLLLADDTRLPNSDYLVKGVVPCEVNVSLKVKLSDNNPLDTVSLSSDIFNYINSLPIGEPVAVSKIISLCHKYNVESVMLPVMLEGTIRAPYNRITDPITDYDILLSGTTNLKVPNLPQYGVTPDNTAFFINYFGLDSQENISISTD